MNKNFNNVEVTGLSNTAIFADYFRKNVAIIFEIDSANIIILTAASLFISTWLM